MTNSELLVGKTIKSIIEGEKDNWDIAWVVHTTDGNMFIIESGSASSQGVMYCEQITEIPKDFKAD